MSYADFGSWFFVAKLAGCFTAYAVTLRGPRDSQVLTFTYGAWLTFVYGLTHTLLADPVLHLTAPQVLRYWWYLFQALVALFPVVCALTLKEAGARRAVVTLGLVLTGVDLAFFIAAAPWLVGRRLPGAAFFDLAATLETLQVLALLGLNRPARRSWQALRRALIVGWQLLHGRWPWIHKRSALKISGS